MAANDGMSMVLDNFPIVDKADWLLKIQRDLRGKTIEDVAWYYDDDLQISPFASAKDTGHTGTATDFQQSWEIAEEFVVDDAKDANEKILSALQGGCETILLFIDSPVEWEILLDNVQLDMIRTYIIPEDESREGVIDSLNSWMHGNDISDGSIRVRSARTAVLGPAHERNHETAVDQLVKTVRSGIDMIELGYEDATLECVVEMGPYYFLEIARVRALKILWRNVLQALEIDAPTLFIEVRMADKFMSDDKYTNMISAGSKALAAVCAKVDRLVINPDPGSDDAFSRRIARNIHHILRYESKMEATPDPVKGAYYLEVLVAQLVEKAWAKITA